MLVTARTGLPQFDETSCGEVVVERKRLMHTSPAHHRETRGVDVRELSVVALP
jgi:hypothetical protein